MAVAKYNRLLKYLAINGGGRFYLRRRSGNARVRKLIYGGSVWPLILGSVVHHVSVPRLVADTHNSNKIDIKNHTFIANGETHYMLQVYIAWAIGLILYIRVLRQRSYVDVAPFVQATWSADVTLNLFLKRVPIS